MRVLVVVLAYAEDVASRARDRRVEGDAGERHFGQGGREPGRSGTPVDQRQKPVFGLVSRQIERCDRAALDIDEADPPISTDRKGRYPHRPSPSIL